MGSFRLFESLDGFGMAMREGLTLSNTAITKGDPLMVDSAGKIVLATLSNAILGISMSTVAATAGVRKKVLYMPAVEGDVYIGRVVTGAVVTEAISHDRGTLSGATGAVFVDADDDANGNLQLIGLAPGQAAGVSLALVLFTIRRSGFTGQV